MKRKTDNFSKFYNKKNNAAIKESFRQEKKAAKKERREAIERRFEERRQAHNPPAPPIKGPHRKTQATTDPAAAKGAPAAGKGHAGKAAATPDRSHSAGAPAGEHLPLNKYIAHGGICSRRDAAEMIRVGKVTVNGKPVTEPGTKVLPTDLVKVNGKKVTISRNFVYILLNKPKDYLTTMDDPQGRRTVVDLIRAATTERVFPVGRLDRNTSGVLLLTNDGDLAQKLAHPSHEIKKVYHVTLDKALTKADFDKIAAGVTLEDGPAHVDVMAYADPKDKTQIGLEIHSGRNRIVRRIFEHLGYDVRGLDRVMYAGLTKKNVQRGKWRFLVEKEIRILKYLNSSIKGSSARAKEWAAAAEIADAELKPKPAPAKAPFKEAASKRPAKPSGGRPTGAKPAGPRAAGPRSAGAKHTGARSAGFKSAGADRKPAGTSFKPAGADRRPAGTGPRPTGPNRKPTLRPRKPKSRPDAD